MAWTHGNTFTFRHSNMPPTADSSESLRAQILRESRQSAAAQRRKGRNPHFHEPDHPGTAAYNLKTGLSELPRERRKATSKARQEKSQQPGNNAQADVILEAASWSSEEHNARMMQEFEELEAASRSHSPTQLSQQSDSYVDYTGSSSSSSSSMQGSADIYPEKFPPIISHRDQCTHAVPKEGQPFYSQPSNFDLDDMTAAAIDENYHAQHSSSIPPLETRPISEEQLIAEVKGIYAGLVMVEKKCVEIVGQQSQSTKRPETHRWKALVALHRTLLQEHHDFFSASQHPTASGPLKQLALKYAMPARMWNYGIEPALQLFSSLPPEANSSITRYIEHAYNVLESLRMELPGNAHEWNMIKYNLCEYLLTLSNDGVEIPTLINNWISSYSPWDKQRRQEYPAMSGKFFGDDDAFYWYTQETFLGQNKPEPFPATSGLGQRLGIEDTAFRVMSGWLHYGRQIATSFHAFANTFIFLGFVGATMAFGK